jgi:hypothetical protein
MAGNTNNNYDGLVHIIADSIAELVIQRAIERIQRMIKPYASDDDNDKATTAAISDVCRNCYVNE